jgi:hypothetical protein
MPSSPQNQGEDSGLHQANSATVNKKKKERDLCSETSGIIPEKKGIQKKKKCPSGNPEVNPDSPNKQIQFFLPSNPAAFFPQKKKRSYFFLLPTKISAS